MRSVAGASAAAGDASVSAATSAVMTARGRPTPLAYARMKKRLDVLLVERGLADSRAQAQALVMAGRVPGHAKPGEQVDEDALLEVEAPPPYVSRAGHKLANALDAFGIDVIGLDALDVGAS